MIIMINGAFGAGKTSVSALLNEQLPNSLIFDPEEVGFMLRNLIPASVKDEHENTGDFQDLELWRTLTVTVASDLYVKYKRNLIIPMTIRNESYFNHIYNGLKALDENTHHFCLSASAKTIESRLIGRGDPLGNWAHKQTHLCLEGFKRLQNTTFIDTEDKGISSIAEEILDYVNTRVE
jgi:deoxyadenosine/deoxycytidine kinase